MREFIKKLVKTDDHAGLLILRITFAAVMLPHGLQKLLGWFGGTGLVKTINGFEAGLGLHPLLTVFVIVIETVGSLLLAAGIFTRKMALLMIAVMMGAVATVHHKFGFFMNWSGKQGGEGYEYHILAVAMMAVLVIYGGGKYSVDRFLSRKLFTEN